MPEDKVLESKVVKETILKNGKSRLALIGVGAALGVAGAALYMVCTSGQLVTRPYVLSVARYGVSQGYSADIWNVIPEFERHHLMKKELSELPVAKSWDIVKPALEAKVKSEWDSTKKEVKDFVSGVQKSNEYRSFKRRVGESAQDAYKALKEYFGDK